jgi:hypothetical protein
VTDQATQQVKARDILEALAGQADVLDVSLQAREHPDDRRHRQQIERGILLFGGVIVVIILAFAMLLVLLPDSADLQKGGLAIVTAVLSGVLGFFAGRGLRP